MAIGVFYNPGALTAHEYDAVIRDLEAAGSSRPAGLIRHTCFGPEDNLMVFDLWESEQAFEEFGKVLRPIMQKTGLDLGSPDILPIHNMIS